ncbi:DNA mismatch repair protein MutS, partial [bacterium]|nr:DNA mismatch repair protein MutS [bacterium]
MPASLTPMMQQYLTLKEKYSDCLLFFRLGDFYEMFFEDALTAARELDIVLTGRDCGLEERAPMCGVPYHSVDSYISRLIEKGYKVAVCEQLTDPALAKGLVERDVVRVFTPGTVIEESMLNERKNNYIAALFLCEDMLGLAYCDVSTGDFTVAELSSEKWQSELTDELARIQPTEIIANDALFLQETLVKRLQSGSFLSCYASWAFEHQQANTRLCAHFGVASLAGFGCDKLTCAVSAAGALLAYLEETQKNSLVHIRKLTVLQRTLFMGLDASTRRNLELTQPLRFEGSKKSTLLYLLDKTSTAMGARLLRAWLEQPLQNLDDINARLDAVEELFKKQHARETLRNALNSIYDIERLCSRIAYGTVHARDCDALRTSLGRLPEVLDAVNTLEAPEFRRIAANLDAMEDICALLKNAIVENPPISVKEGGVIRDGFNSEVDTLREAARNGKSWIAKMEADERAATGIKNLKIGYNRVFGYYIDVTKSYQSLVPYTYQRKQTLANSERYITPELKELEETIVGAEEKLVALEYKLFLELRETLSGCIERLQKNAKLIAELDVYRSFAQVAFENNYCRPHMQKKGAINIVDGRHPVVERSIKEG